MDFVNKTAIVVGGLGGIGSELCKLLLTKGISNLGIFDISDDNEPLENIEASNNGNAKIKFWKVDITKRADCDSAFDSAICDFEYVDIVIISVGIVDELNPSRALEVNLLGTININLTAIKCMDKKADGRGGTILTISSVLGLEPSPSYPVYAATKHGIMGFLRSIGTEDFQKLTGIQIKVVCPGLTKPSMPTSAPEAIFPYLPTGSPDDRFQSTPHCAECIINALDYGLTGSIWIVDNAELTQVAPINYFFPPRAY